jgi:hypothetical protein
MALHRETDVKPTIDDVLFSCSVIKKQKRTKSYDDDDYNVSVISYYKVYSYVLVQLKS